MLTISGIVLAISLLTNIVVGFSSTSPVIAWSSKSSMTIDSLPSRLEDGMNTLSIVQTLIDAGGICDVDAVIFVEQPGLQAFDLRLLSEESFLHRRVHSSPSTRQYPYVHSHSTFDALAAARMVSTTCQSHLLQTTLGNVPTTLEHPDEKYAIAIVMPGLSDFGKVRKDLVAEYESVLSQELDNLANKFTNHLVVLIGSPVSFLKRQVPLNQSGNGILHKYQLLTPDLIVSLLVFFFLILPIVVGGVRSLASIQNPIRMDTTKSFSAQEKKNQ